MLGLPLFYPINARVYYGQCCLLIVPPIFISLILSQCQQVISSITNSKLKQQCFSRSVLFAQNTLWTANHINPINLLPSPTSSQSFSFLLFLKPEYYSLHTRLCVHHINAIQCIAQQRLKMSLNILFGFFSESNRLKISSVVKKKI